MGAFQDFVRGLAASSDRLPQAMQVRWQRQQAEKASEQADADRQRQLVLQRLGLFIQAAQGGANVTPSPEVARLLGEALQRPMETIPGGEVATVPGTDPGIASIMKQFNLPAATEQETPWNEVFRPKRKYINTPAGTFEDTPDGLRLAIPPRDNKGTVVEGDTGHWLVDPTTGEKTDLGIGVKPSGGSDREQGIADRNFSNKAFTLTSQVSLGTKTKEEAIALLRASARQLKVDESSLESAIEAVNQAVSRVPLTADAMKQLAGYKTLEVMGERLLRKLADPKVRAGLGRLPGMYNSAKAWITGKSPEAIPPELLAFWVQFGIDKDTIMRVWSGAQTSEQEADRIAGILGGNWDSAGALQISVQELITNARDRQGSIVQNAARLKAGDYGGMLDRQPGAVDYDLMDPQELMRKAVEGDEAAEREMDRRERSK